MANKRESIAALKEEYRVEQERTRLSADLHDRLRKIDREIVELEDAISKPKMAGAFTDPKQSEKAEAQWRGQIDDLKMERAQVKSKIEEIMTGGIEKGFAPAPGTEKIQRPAGEPTRGEAPPAAETGGIGAGVEGGAPGEQPQYDINIGIGEKGELIAPEGMTPEQVAIMVPGAFGASTPSQIKEASEGVSRPTTPPGDRPPEDFRPTSYKDRERFEQNVFEQIGFNPVIFDPYDYVNRAMKQLPQLFNHVFQGRIMWADRNKMSKKELAHWQSVVKMFRADNLAQGKSIQDKGMRKYNWMMNKFDYTAKKKEQRLKELRQAPTTKELWSDAKGAMTLHEWDPNGRKWVDTGRVSDAPTAKQTPEQKAKDTAYKRAWDLVKRFSSSFAQEDIGDEPTDETDAAAKMDQIMAILGEGKIDERIRPMYEEALKTIREYWGITEEVTGAAGAEPTMKFDATGKRIQ